jgi:hypothetical protein
MKISRRPSPPSSHWPASRSRSADSRDSCLLSQALSQTLPSQLRGGWLHSLLAQA